MTRRMAWLTVLAVAPVLAAEPAPPGGAFNLRIVSDSVPDFSSRERFVYSALSNWPSDREKALAQFRWMHRCRRVGPYQPEDSRPVLDPILFFNSYGITFCSMISEMNCSLWEAWGKPNRVVDLDGHVVSEVFYDGRWRLFDSDFCNYLLTDKGEVAGVADLAASRIHGNVADLKPGEYYIFDHCPTASSPRGKIIMGPSAWSLIDVARYWYPGPDKFWPRLNYTGSHAGHRYILGIRPNETYTRHWRPIGTGDLYARPLTNGEDPAVGSKLRNSRGNGEWVWEPDLSDTRTFFAAENVGLRRRDFGAALVAQDPSKPAFVVFRVAAANVVTSARLFTGAVGRIRYFVSANGGVSWHPPEWRAVINGHQQVDLRPFVAGRLEYLVKIELDGEGALIHKPRFTTITQVNHRTLPALRLGANRLVAVSDEHLEYVTFNPRLADHAEKGEVFKAEGFQSIEKPHDYEPSARGVGKSELVLRATAPRDIRHIRMAGTLHLTEPGADTYYQVSYDGGKTWKDLAHIRFPGAPYDKRVSAETRDVPPGTREALLRYFFDWGGNGLVNVFAEVGYEPAGPRMPYDVTYNWSEHRDGKWVERSHTERVNDAYHAWQVNVGGTRPPRMNWVRVGPAGSGQTGCSDGEDVGEKEETATADGRRWTPIGATRSRPAGSMGNGEPKANNETATAFARPGYQLTYGKKVSVGCPYTVGRPPSAAYPDCLPIMHPKPDEQTGWARPPRTVGTKDDPRTLTDDYIGMCDFWGGASINLSGERNPKRVGELVAWEAGDEVVVTLDLGKVQTVGGAAVAALQPNAKVLYPAVMTVETSPDGKTFVKAGEVGWEDCFFPPADAVLWEGHDSPLYDDLPAGGIRDHKFPILFEKPVRARYVRFRLAPPEDRTAGIALWELEVYDGLRKEPWSDRIRLAAGR